jgi:Fic family protein
MNTFKQFFNKFESIPTSTTWYIAELSEARGKQELFTRQAPQKLKALREHAMIESAISSNRIEGVSIDQARVNTVVLGKKQVLDRNEEEVRGYRNGLKWIHENFTSIPLTEKTVRELHRLSRGDIWDAGSYKDKDGDIIEKYPDGRTRIRFKTVTAKATPKAMLQLTEAWKNCLQEQKIHPLIAVAAYNLDFLCIHPFRDGNGRVSRLLLLLQTLKLGYTVGHYISLERTIEESKERYYETLEHSSQGWHEAKHDPWLYINYLLSILRQAYREFEDRLERVKSPRGAKTEQIYRAIDRFSGTFTLQDIQRACMGTSQDMVRKVLRDLQNAGGIECLGRGPGAKWRRKGTTLKRG